jgi:hypothetical protein
MDVVQVQLCSSRHCVLLMCTYCIVLRIYKYLVVARYKYAYVGLLDELMAKYIKNFH